MADMSDDPFAVGRRYGGFTILEHFIVTDDPIWGQYENYSLCRCDCGKIEKVIDAHLTTKGISKRCRECTEQRRKFPHFADKDRLLYKIWERMVWRCHHVTQGHTDYRYYRGRGITVCDEWRASFAAFRDWALAHGYAEGLSIDRIDNDGGYRPDNCRWVTMAEQAKNKHPRGPDTKPRRPYRTKRRLAALATAN